MKRMWTWVAVCVSVAALAAGLTAQEDASAPADAAESPQAEAAEAPEANVTLRAVGLSVTLDDENDVFTDYGRPEGLAEDIVPGTAVYFVVALDPDALLEVLPGESVIEAFTDSAGQVLLEPGSALREGAIGLRAVDEDFPRTGFRFMIASELLPAEGATSLHVKGALALTLRGEGRTATIRNVGLVKEETFELPGREVTIEDVESSTDSTYLSLESSVNFETLGAIRFLDAEGNEIAAEDHGVSWATSGDVTTYGQSFGLDGVHQAITIEVDYFEPVPVSVPIDVTIGLGM